jgi:hypothetical protein
VGGKGWDPDGVDVEIGELFVFQNEVAGSEEVQSQIRL